MHSVRSSPPRSVLPDGSVLLISTYELGHQPLGLASPAAHLLAAGFPVECLDLAVEPFDEQKIQRAQVVGISVPMHTALRLGVRVAERVRALNRDCRICFYGLYASLNDDYLLETCADAVVGGEFETPLVQLVKHLAGENGVDLTGISTRSRRSPAFLGRQGFLVPARHLLPPLDRYARLDTGTGELRTVGYVEASRGCAHRCRHCPIPPVYEGRLRIVQEDVVLRDIRNLVAMGARHITFGDPDFLNGVKHSMRVVTRMKEEFPDLSFDVTAKIEHILEHRALVQELGRLGCLFIVSAVESLNDEILRLLAKGHTAADVAQALEITRGAGVALRPSLLPFTPWTTLADYLELFEFVEEQGLVYHIDPVQYSIRLLIPPGSWVLAVPEIQPFLGPLEEESFSYRWRHRDPRLEWLYGAVRRVVESAARSGEDPLVTFRRIREAALQAAGPSARHRRPVRERPWAARADPPLALAIPPRRPPRLTEPWFCCAEPMEEQFRPLVGAQAAV